MKLSIVFVVFASTFLLSLLQAPTFALQKGYIVYLGSHSHGSVVTSADIQRVENSHYDLLGSVTNSKEKAREKIFYSYTKNINGFAALLDEDEVSALKNRSEVLSVFPNRPRTLHTTRTWNFLGLEQDGDEIPEDSLWVKARFGEDVIIGNIDTGIWPEHKSFRDEGLGPIPSRWKGFCQQSRRFGVHCNRKLIGARYFNKGFISHVGDFIKNNDTYFTARDFDFGHGTHTLSTAAGNFVPRANILGYANGTAKGGSPLARVAAYRVCWPPISESSACYEADILAGLEAAISDGVDVLSISLGFDLLELYEDVLAIGAFHAVKNGIVVTASAGNGGPSPSSLINTAPWFITVGAGTLDRNITNYISLGNKVHLKGTSLSRRGLPKEQFYPVISAADAGLPNISVEEASLCLNDTLDPGKVKGKILLCNGGTNGVDKSVQALKAGAVGLILANNVSEGGDISPDPYFLAGSAISYTDGQTALAYINSTKNPTAYITYPRTVLGVKPAPLTADFSSRGPDSLNDEILKPDVIAPGVDILAAISLTVPVSRAENDTRYSEFKLMSGTSMSAPHVAGVAGLLKAVHPHWSPAAILSAIITTATTEANDQKPILDQSTGLAAGPFDFGAGHIRPSLAVDPGLVYDISINDYLNYLCARGYNSTQIRLFSGKPYTCPKSFSLADFNYPSISVTKLNKTLTVTRTVTNVGGPATYKAISNPPEGVSISVNPRVLRFEKTGEKRTYKVTFNVAVPGEPKDYAFGYLTWSDGKRNVTSPLVIKSSQV